MRFSKSYIIAPAFLLLYACTGKMNQKADPETTQVPAAASVAPAATAHVLPQFAVLDASGKTIDIQSFKGKKVFVNLWATWCPPCRAEMPSIDKLYQAADKEKTQFVLLSLDKDFETAKQYVQDHKLNVPIFYPAADLPDLFAVNGIPTTFIFNEAGELTEQHEGSEDYNTKAYRKLFGATN